MVSRNRLYEETPTESVHDYLIHVDVLNVNGRPGKPARTAGQHMLPK